MAGHKRFSLNISLHAETRQRLIDLASRRQINFSQLLEDLIDEAWDTEEHFTIKHSAMQSFVGAALAIATASKVLGKEGARTDAE